MGQTAIWWFSLQSTWAADATPAGPQRRGRTSVKLSVTSHASARCRHFFPPAVSRDRGEAGLHGNRHKTGTCRASTTPGLASCCLRITHPVSGSSVGDVVLAWQEHTPPHALPRSASARRAAVEGWRPLARALFLYTASVKICVACLFCTNRASVPGTLAAKFSWVFQDGR